MTILSSWSRGRCATVSSCSKLRAWNVSVCRVSWHFQRRRNGCRCGGFSRSGSGIRSNFSKMWTFCSLSTLGGSFPLCFSYFSLKIALNPRLEKKRFSRSPRCAFLCTFGIFAWEKPGKPHSETAKEIEFEKRKQRKCPQTREQRGTTITKTTNIHDSAQWFRGG